MRFLSCRTQRAFVTDWFDDREDVHPSWAADESWMRLYIVLGLTGIGALGMIGGMLHVLPA
ncbi:hypothetical protein GCM10007890_58670 [Methylobacterium tardum]|uniref:Uncharacterized protein n=1 Tax=Methylobacterium tardum TaxID=374432 RepID=A0AA37TKI1_9HYPH|nr:hypothetical protein GCM10007890_58670 [Methylobacterium tardum]